MGESRQVLTDYTVYTLSGRQRTVCMLISGLLFFGVGILFYHHWLAGVILAAGCIWVPKHWTKVLLERRRMTLSLHFKQALYALSSALAAGKSVENGFKESVEDLRMLNPEADTDLIREFTILRTRMEYGQPIEEALQDFSDRAGIEDITNFADVFITCKRTGGDLVEVVRRTSAVIGEKLDIQQDIMVAVAQKRFESKAMFAAPFIFLIFLNLTAKDFMEPLYSGMGYLISSVALVLLACCYLWITRIMDIKV
ncbi:type II secretion system F family protein [Paenibacillus illinoisensis]|uniref:type II secretion system F family protein n=1 Tax=Paenibacillus illinoisensis TaxID=59845 RepID=UPI001C8DA65C|nr:type II secretion system F family protein [Paenibacillus illinoisensis]MBY0219312.1 type II secretion system F family protein [Paenibacillus illinoisensis]MCM3204561.1 type II secretion system F family protein [Paenibacillus illinoisensis]